MGEGRSQGDFLADFAGFCGGLLRVSVALLRKKTRTKPEGFRARAGSARGFAPRKRPRVSGAHASALSTRETRRVTRVALNDSKRVSQKRASSLTTRHSDFFLKKVDKTQTLRYKNESGKTNQNSPRRAERWRRIKQNLINLFKSFLKK